jgi:hypothetical protein
MKATVTTEDHGFEVVDLPDPPPTPTSSLSASRRAESAGPTSKPSRSHRPAW